MSQQTKTDSRRLDLKLQLRRMTLGRAALDELRVLDLCAGAGEVWRSMRQTVKIEDYVPMDISPRLPGTIQGDMMDERFLSAFDLSLFTVIDIDAYGEPWKPWRFIFERLTTKTAVFLTHGGTSSPGGSRISKFAREIMGIPLAWEIPMKLDLSLFAANYLLLAPSPAAIIERGWKISLGNGQGDKVSYYGLICGPRKEKENHG